MGAAFGGEEKNKIETIGEAPARFTDKKIFAYRSWSAYALEALSYSITEDLMDGYTISLSKSLLFVGMFVIASHLCIPKAIRSWELWKKTKKTVYFSNTVASIAAAFFFYSADFIILVMRLIGGA